MTKMDLFWGSTISIETLLSNPTGKKVKFIDDNGKILLEVNCFGLDTRQAPIQIKRID